ncbi:DUF6000 family protein [Streptomyces roseolus]|uniref:DUF6000 family protein n=1 Tax=Streptomyces roseolus TaxID=67358 RepID=UPI0033FEC488
MRTVLAPAPRTAPASDARTTPVPPRHRPGTTPASAGLRAEPSAPRSRGDVPLCRGVRFEITPAELGVLFEGGWRERKTAAWMVARRREQSHGPGQWMPPHPDAHRRYVRGVDGDEAATGPGCGHPAGSEGRSEPQERLGRQPRSRCGSTCRGDVGTTSLVGVGRDHGLIPRGRVRR